MTAPTTRTDKSPVIKNRWYRKGDTVFIEIRRRNGEVHTAKCDYDDFQNVVRHYRCWRVIIDHNSFDSTILYCGTNYKRGRRVLKLHHAILGELPEGKKVMFRNGDGLDCRRANVRFATHEEIKQRVLQPLRSATGHRNVYNHSQKGYMVQITIMGKQHYAYRHTLAEAINARDELLKAHGFTDNGKRLCA